jgi:hypothetical protein
MNARLVAGSAVFLGLYACIPHPSEDYDRFVKDTETLRGLTAGDGGDIDAKPPTEALKGVYFAACYSDLMASNLHKTLRFFVQSEFVPDAGGGKLSLKLYALKTGARTVSQSESVGDPLEFAQTKVAANGKFSSSVAKGTIAGEGNPFSGREIVATPLILDGRFGDKARFCSTFLAKVTAPIVQEVNAVCIFTEQAEGDAFTLSGDPIGPSDSLKLTKSSATLKVPDFVCQ